MNKRSLKSKLLTILFLLCCIKKIYYYSSKNALTIFYLIVKRCSEKIGMVGGKLKGVENSQLLSSVDKLQEGVAATCPCSLY